MNKLKVVKNRRLNLEADNLKNYHSYTNSAIPWVCFLKEYTTIPWGKSECDILEVYPWIMTWIGGGEGAVK